MKPYKALIPLAAAALIGGCHPTSPFSLQQARELCAQDQAVLAADRATNAGEVVMNTNQHKIEDIVRQRFGVSLASINTDFALIRAEQATAATVDANDAAQKQHDVVCKPLEPKP